METVFAAHKHRFGLFIRTIGCDAGEVEDRPRQHCLQCDEVHLPENKTDGGLTAPQRAEPMRSQSEPTSSNTAMDLSRQNGSSEVSESDLGEGFEGEGVVPSGELDLARDRTSEGAFSQQVDGEVAQVARFCGPLSLRFLVRPSSKVTSRTQCRPFSMLQWARTISRNRTALMGFESRKRRQAVVVPAPFSRMLSTTPMAATPGKRCASTSQGAA